MKPTHPTGPRPEKASLPPEDHPPQIRKISSGVRGLDEIFGGGIPEYSFNVIAGTPGCGKTTLAHQIAFTNGTEEKPALYFTVLGEPSIKMIRYQQQFDFFDIQKIGKSVRFINLSDFLIKQGLPAVIDEISKQVKAADPSIVVVDSFRSVIRTQSGSVGEKEMQLFIQQLSQFLTGWQATTFLVGEYDISEIRDNALFTVADGIFWLSQETERNSVVRKLQVIKIRGQKSVPGLHTIRITDTGLEAFSRTLGLGEKKSTVVASRHPRRRISLGIPELDTMLDGGIFEGDSLLVTGPSGTGKSALATHFIAEGIRNGEPGIMAIFEERPQGYSDRALSFGLNFDLPQDQEKLEILYLRPLDLSVDETMQAILEAIQKIGAKRLVIDSLVGFEMALAPSFRADFRESLYRMIGALTGAGVTILSTVEVEDTFGSLQLSHYAISFLTDDIIRMRYVEIDGQLRKVLIVIKMRGGNHSKDIREYIITDKGIVIIAPRRTDYVGLTSGLAQKSGQRLEVAPEPRILREQ